MARESGCAVPPYIEMYHRSCDLAKSLLLTDWSGKRKVVWRIFRKGRFVVAYPMSALVEIATLFINRYVVFVTKPAPTRHYATKMSQSRYLKSSALLREQLLDRLFKFLIPYPTMNYSRSIDHDGSRGSGIFVEGHTPCSCYR